MLNVKYYSYQLAKAKKKTFWIELILAASSSASISGLWLFKDWIDGFLWKALGAIAAFLAVYKVTAKSSENIQKLEQRVTTYRAIAFDLQYITRNISDSKNYDAEMTAQFDAIMNRKRGFILSYEDPFTDKNLLDRCMDEVNRELPVGNFYVPKEGDDA